jgi:hypothetical protein
MPGSEIEDIFNFAAKKKKGSELSSKLSTSLASNAKATSSRSVSSVRADTAVGETAKRKKKKKKNTNSEKGSVVETAVGGGDVKEEPPSMKKPKRPPPETISDTSVLVPAAKRQKTFATPSNPVQVSKSDRKRDKANEAEDNFMDSRGTGPSEDLSLSFAYIEN